MEKHARHGLPRTHHPPTEIDVQRSKSGVRTTYGLTDWFDIGQGVRQGCISSPSLFKVYSEVILRNSLSGFEGSVKVSGHSNTNFRYADGVALIAGSMEELQDLVDRVRHESEDKSYEDQKEA